MSLIFSQWDKKTDAFTITKLTKTNAEFSLSLSLSISDRTVLECDTAWLDAPEFRLQSNGCFQWKRNFSFITRHFSASHYPNLLIESYRPRKKKKTIMEKKNFQTTPPFCARPALTRLSPDHAHFRPSCAVYVRRRCDSAPLCVLLYLSVILFTKAHTHPWVMWSSSFTC